MERLVAQTRASDKDAAISDQKIDGVPFREFFANDGIRVLVKEEIQSCHGNGKYSKSFAGQLQQLADAGHKVVGFESGGLTFARPSLEAVHAYSVPIISVPLGGLNAFLCADLPAGVAAIGGVAPGNYGTAARAAKTILLRDFEGVYVWGVQSSRLDDAITLLKIPVLGRVSPSSPRSVDGILIGEAHPTDFKRFEECTSLGIYSAGVDPNYLMRASQDMHHSVYVRGPENLAFFAAKILAHNHPEIKKALFDARENKEKSYDEPVSLMRPESWSEVKK